MISTSLEMYLIEIYMQVESDEEITCSDIARSLDVPIKKVIQAAQRLHYQKYIQYTTYQPITMTKKGEKLAKYIISKDKLLDNFLDILQITENTALEKETMGQYLSYEALSQIEQFVTFVNSYPEILNRYKLYLKKNSATSILEPIPEEER
ncbi:MAG: hypothetical protein BEN19_08760 [Epulopiscium sp. Nuni2H_MBin003]|nr:MAG: hypothetical protein BEN19_08760 [Epulopiscium sp. Nuni2H_MBin003]